MTHLERTEIRTFSRTQLVCRGSAADQYVGHFCIGTNTPGSPWQNGFVESFNGKLRDELLNREWFRSRAEARILIEQWRHFYNEQRPHSAHGYQPPAQVRHRWLESPTIPTELTA